MLLFVVDGDWSAFEHTLTPLTGGLSPGSFLMSSVATEHFSLSDMLLQQIPSCLGKDANSADGSLSKTSTSVDAVVISDDDDRVACDKPGPAVSYASSQMTADKSSNRLGVTLTEVRMQTDISRAPTVNRCQALQGHTARNSRHLSRKKDRSGVDKTATGKENIRPPSGSQSELSRLNARNCLDLERQIPYTKNQESGNMNHWMSPSRHSVSNASNSLTRSQLLLRDGHQKSTVIDVNEGFSALAVVSNDSFDSCVDQGSLSKFSEDGLSSKLDEGQFKRSSSTPVKDQSLHEPIRFRSQQHGSSLDKDNREQRKSSLQSLREMLPQDVDISQSDLHQDKQSTTAHTVTQSQVDMADHVHSASSSFDESVMMGDVTYESTVFLTLPAHGNADSIHLQQETGCPEVGTQTSFLSAGCPAVGTQTLFLSSTYDDSSKEASSYHKDKPQQLHNRRMDSRIVTLGNHL